jgi:hypothetical protein
MNQRDLINDNRQLPLDGVHAHSTLLVGWDCYRSWSSTALSLTHVEAGLVRCKSAERNSAALWCRVLGKFPGSNMSAAAGGAESSGSRLHTDSADTTGQAPHLAPGHTVHMSQRRSDIINSGGGPEHLQRCHQRLSARSLSSVCPAVRFSALLQHPCGAVMAVGMAAAGYTIIRGTRAHWQARARAPQPDREAARRSQNT